MSKIYDYIIVGSGIMGLTIAHTLKQNRNPKILIVEKESDVAHHASGRNSGVLHAGFYYTADSLKAKFTVAGNKAMKAYCRQKNLPMNECGKLVVAQDEGELNQLYELEKRGLRNGSNVKIVDEKEAQSLEPNVRTFKKALYSPDTTTIDPKKVCQSLKEDLLNKETDFLFNTIYLGKINPTNGIRTNQGDFEAIKVINCAGLYADKVADDFGFGQQYTMIPFKGLYLKYTKNKTDVKMHIYPVPNLKNPFLGVHFTKTVYGDIKIGPTAIPALWRENYDYQNFSFSEFCEILFHESKLFCSNAFGFRQLAQDEIKKYNKDHFIALAQKMVQQIDPQGFTEFTQPGIRAQLLNKRTSLLVQDFVVEGDKNSIHLLNAVSPAFTCSFPFAEFVIKSYNLS